MTTTDTLQTSHAILEMQASRDMIADFEAARDLIAKWAGAENLVSNIEGWIYDEQKALAVLEETVYP